MNKKYISPCIRVKVISSATLMVGSKVVGKGFSTPEDASAGGGDNTMSSGEDAVTGLAGGADRGEADSKRFNLWGSPDVEE